MARKSEFFSSIQPFVNSFNEYRTSLFISLALLLLFPYFGFSQSLDTLILVNGKTVNCTNAKTDSVFVTYQRQKKSGKLKKETRLDREMVFSIRRVSGEEVLYNPSPAQLRSGDFTVEQMRYFILGQQDARNNYKTHWWTVGGLVIGGGLGYAAYDQIYVAVIPFAYTLAAGFTPVEFNATPQRVNSELNIEAYQIGYLRAAKSKRVFRALESSLLGTAIGVGVGYATN